MQSSSRFVLAALMTMFLLSIHERAGAATSYTTPVATQAQAHSGTDGYGMTFSFQGAPDCRVTFLFDGPELVKHLPYLQTNDMVSKDLTPFIMQQETDVVSIALGQRAVAVALPNLAKDAAIKNCEVLFQVIYTRLSTTGPHDLLKFSIDRDQAGIFGDHIPKLSEIRAKSTDFTMSPDDIAGIALEADHAQEASLKH